VANRIRLRVTRALLPAVADALPAEADLAALKGRGVGEKSARLLDCAVRKLFRFLGTEWERERGLISDFISFGPPVYEPFPFHDTIRRAEALGLPGVRCHTVDLGGASVAAALDLAKSILTARPEALLLVGGADVPRGGYSGAGDYERLNSGVMHPVYEAPLDVTLPANYALAAQRLMFESGVTQADLEAIATHARNAVQSTPRAANFGKPITDKELKRLQVDPYSGPMMALMSDHGFATLIAGEATLDRLIRERGWQMPADPVEVLGAGFATHAEYFIRKGAGQSPAALAAHRARRAAGVALDSVDYAWIYDCFTGMTIAQAAAYFRQPVRDVARSLGRGEVYSGARDIPVNLGGGICNYQAAINISGATGLIDALSQYGLSADPGVTRLPTPPRITLLGGNGGIDTINGVVFLGKSGAADGAEAAELRAALAHEPEPRLTLNDPALTENLEVRLHATTTVRFNPGARGKTPYVLAHVRKPDGQIGVVRVTDVAGAPLAEAGGLELDRTRLRCFQREGRWCATPLA
jgi:acetyl-CoA acyltransferase